MKKTIIAVVTLAAASLVKQPIQRGPVKVGLLVLQVRPVGKDLLQIKLIFNGTSGSNKNGDEWTNAQLFIQGTTGNSQKHHYWRNS